jgi:O-antigen ligase
VVVGGAIAIDASVGMALLVGACAAPLVLVDLSFGIALWAALMPLASLRGFGLGGSAVAFLVTCAWLGLPGRERGRLRVKLTRPGGAGALLLLLAWISLSLVWAEKPGKGGSDLWHWYLGALVFGIVATSFRRRRDARLVIGGFVLGVVCSVLIGVATDGPGGQGASAGTLTSTEGRLHGGLGDPNILAAAIVAAVVLATTLIPAVRTPARWALLACIGLLTVGLAATQSRGGAIAAAAAFAVALLVMKKRRKHVLAAGLGIALVGALYFSAYPTALERLRSSDGGNGRADLWQVAWRIAAQRPATGVGLGNFTVYSPRYVREPGPLKFVDLIAERPHTVHNTYLQLLTETGIAGLVLFLAVLAASLGAAWQAAALFERHGDDAFATLSRGLFAATVAVLVAAVFVTLGSHPMLWFLLALGPALLGIAALQPSALDGLPLHERRVDREGASPMPSAGSR